MNSSPPDTEYGGLGTKGLASQSSFVVSQQGLLYRCLSGRGGVVVLKNFYFRGVGQIILPATFLFLNWLLSSRKWF